MTARPVSRFTPHPAGRSIAAAPGGMGGDRLLRRSQARRLRVLIAEDDRDTADSTALLVELWGYAARVARDGPEALHLALAFRPHVVLLDIALPGVDGYRVASGLRQRRRTAATLLVAVTGYSDESYRLLASQAGFDHYFVKPADLSFLQNLFAQAHERLVAAARRRTVAT